MRYLVLLLLSYAALCRADNVQDIQIHQYSSSTYYVDVSIGDQQAQPFLIDTGASHVTVTNETIEHLLKQGGAVFLSRVSAKLANGTTINLPVYRVDTLRVGNNCAFQDVEVAVVPDGTRCVLGLSALKRAA
ncbi:MAG: retropepsin-like aspartic protease, partial [Granulosicoccaceae bacterium]